MGTTIPKGHRYPEPTTEKLGRYTRGSRNWPTTSTERSSTTTTGCLPQKPIGTLVVR